MERAELLAALGRLRVETGSLACLGCGHEHNCGTHGCAILRAAAETIAALHPISREQVEKVWRGEWKKDSSVQVLAPGGQKYHFRCSKCGYITRLHDLNFCSKCGTPMTDEAVQMVMERLEALKDGKAD